MTHVYFELFSMFISHSMTRYKQTLDLGLFFILIRALRKPTRPVLILEVEFSAFKLMCISHADAQMFITDLEPGFGCHSPVFLYDIFTLNDWG